MRFGFLAMSGVRVEDPELRALGMTLPAVRDRVRVIAELPSLSLLTLAALTPPDIEIDYREVRTLDDAQLLDYDLVAISTLSAQAFEAYELADRYRERGVPVVLGGLHATVMPEEAGRHATSIVIGEGEPVWPRLVADFLAGQLRSTYRARPDEDYDLAEAPMPRFDLLEPDRYNRFTVQTSRGCPYRCDFCAGSILLTPRYKYKPVENVVAEIRRLKELRRRPFVEFADDNSFATRGRARRLIEAIAPERIRWFTETDISIADDPGLLDAMYASGCREVLIGLESPRAQGLDGVELRGNWKARQLRRYEDAIRTIQSSGIAVNGCFILGLDGDTEGVFSDILAFARRASLYDVQLTVLTPFPGTPLYERLLREGRILKEGAWNRCTLFDVNFQPRNMSPEQLRRGLIDLARRMYDPDFVADRRQGFLRQRHGLGSLTEETNAR